MNIRKFKWILAFAGAVVVGNPGTYHRPPGNLYQPLPRSAGRYVIGRFSFLRYFSGGTV